ncbi:LysR family transcriptional regulator [Sphingorhabdus sp. Alg239-R122]|uniref:LysR family transcriptional regulator n=1 Tax=Sphingorhabdus sp. Alg239-R122 TaxID=2305989 RepID=UPI0013DAAD9F|nr:LysR family transcriptional regulator [Sphingorhabdus sp. Alg239-R122]
MKNMDWEDIRIFRAVMREGTVRRAASKLGVHHSTVSRRIDSLEKSVSARLFDRLPAGYAPTSAGEELAVAAHGFAEELNDVTRHIAGRDDDLHGKLIVTIAEPLAVRAFAPRLPEFAALHPELDLEIIASFEQLDMARREADVAVRMHNDPPEALVGRKLFPYHTSIYASPDYLERHDITGDSMSARWIGWGDNVTPFPEWAQDTQFAKVPAWGTFANMNMQIELARAGMGLTMLPCFLADSVPGLVRATTAPPKPSRDIWILTHSDLRRTAKVRAFMNFAESVLRPLKPMFLGILE